LLLKLLKKKRKKKEDQEKEDEAKVDQIINFQRHQIQDIQEENAMLTKKLDLCLTAINQLRQAKGLSSLEL